MYTVRILHVSIGFCMEFFTNLRCFYRHFKKRLLFTLYLPCKLTSLLTISVFVCVFLQSKRSVSKRGFESDGSSTKKKKSKSSKKHKVYSPEHSSSSKEPQPHKDTNKNNKMPQMTTDVVNVNGQHHICSNSKVHRINAWVNSVDTSYAPSEQGSCVSANVPSSHAGSDEFNHNVGEFPTKNPYCKPAQVQNTTGRVSTQQCNRTVSSDKCNDNVRILSAPLSQHNQKGSFSGDVNIHVPVRNNVSKNLKQSSKTPAVNSTVHTPFSPLSHYPTVLGINSDKTDTGQKLPSAAAYQAQVEEDMQLDSQVSLQSFVNDNFEAQHETTQLSDNNDIAMEIDNYEELQDQIKLEVRTYQWLVDSISASLLP